MIDNPPVLNQLNSIVRDMDESLEFYRHVGLDIPGDRRCVRLESGRLDGAIPAFGGARKVEGP